MKKNIAAVSCAFLFGLAGCSTSTTKQTSTIDDALRLCGLGTNTLAYDSLKAALSVASSQPSASFEKNANQQIETQITILLKQGKQTSDASFKFAAEQLNATRECAVKQMSLLRGPNRAELLEQCRADVFNKLQPSQLKEGVLDAWNQADGELSGSKDVVKMRGYYHKSSFFTGYVTALCDVTGGRFNESVIVSSDK